MKLAQWFLRSRLEGKVNIRTDGQIAMAITHLSLWLRWAKTTIHLCKYIPGTVLLRESIKLLYMLIIYVIAQCYVHVHVANHLKNVKYLLSNRFASK